MQTKSRLNREPSKKKKTNRTFRLETSISTFFLFLFRDVFQGLNELKLLDLEYNDLSYLDSNALGHLEQLKHARFSHNKLSFLDDEGHQQGGFHYKDTFGNKSPFRHCINLEYLYLANNSITEIFSDWRIVLVKLRVLDLSLNRIQYLLVSTRAFQNKPKLFTT